MSSQYGALGGGYRHPVAPQGGFAYPWQPVAENLTDLHRNDTNVVWKEYYDSNTDSMYYYNTISNTTQWEHPKGVTVKKQPPPPSSLPPRSVSYEMREHEKWMHITNDPKMGEYWFNVVTKETQRDRPACCMKYPK
eukprot:jgi/Undpi1/328/HiC_scaffold_1.g00324.m1